MGLDLEALKQKYDPEHGWASARDEECREVLALIEELAEARAQLPEGMKHCTILFKECEKGHGWLTATNWVQHGCPHCDLANARAAAMEEAAPPGFRVVEEEVIHSILGHIEASMQHTHGVDCRGFDDGDDINSDGDCGCGLVSASKARAALAALEGVKP